MEEVASKRVMHTLRESYPSSHACIPFECILLFQASLVCAAWVKTCIHTHIHTCSKQRYLFKMKRGVRVCIAMQEKRGTYALHWVPLFSCMHTSSYKHTCKYTYTHTYMQCMHTYPSSYPPPPSPHEHPRALVSLLCLHTCIRVRTYITIQIYTHKYVQRIYTYIHTYIRT